MSDSKGLTLRKKGGRRPQISGPQQISGPVPSKQAPSSSGGTLAVPREKNLQPGGTSDLVKRRYSARFNQLPDFSAGTPPVPGIPQIPNQYAGSRQRSPGRPGTGGSGKPLRFDVEALRDPNLQPEKYVTELLSAASEQDIEEYQNSLKKIKNRTSTDLQQNVYQNRTQFIKISKEAEKLKGEMNTLKNLMSELTGALGQTGNSSLSGMKSPNFEEGRARRNANRSSVANLESMWNTQLQTLWKKVERSQKFLPAIPGRHIVMENGHWVELDSATWKPKRPVHLVMLNDHLLVASKKRKRVDPNGPQRGPAPTKLVAEECWPLNGIDLIDLGANLASGGVDGIVDERNIGTAVTVRSANKSFTYRHEQRDENAKNDLLLIFRKAVEDLRKTQRQDLNDSGNASDALNYFAARDPASAKQADIMDGIQASKEKPEILIEVDGKQQNFRWVEAQIDELDIDIALQHFESAVSKIEKLKMLAKGLKSNPIAQDLVLVRLDERASKLATTLTRALIDTHSYNGATKANTTWLARLGFDDRAREAFLRARTDVINRRARQCVFEGDLHKYVFQVSYVYFIIIRNTVKIYQDCFPALMMSACIKWVKEQLDNFNIVLVRQLSSVDAGSPVWQECMQVVKEHENMLHEVGLDFRNLITTAVSSGVAKFS
ncbi:MAG: hypothetical protein Q9160_000551 [Pyrenula sp. 1 TL-2023]